MKRMLLGLCLLASFGTPRIWAVEAAPGADAKETAGATNPRIDAQAVQLLHATAAYYAAAKTLQGRLNVTFSIQHQDGPLRETSATTMFAVSKPNRLWLDYNGPQAGTVIMNGTTITLLSHDASEVMQVTQQGGLQASDFAEQAAMRSIYQVSAGTITSILPLISSDPYQAITQRVQSAAVVGDSTVDGVACTEIHLDQPPVPVTVSIAKGTKPALMRVVPDMAAVFKRAQANGAKTVPKKYDIIYTFRNVIIDGEIPKARFNAAIPAGYLRVEKLVGQTPPGREQPAALRSQTALNPQGMNP